MLRVPPPRGDGSQQVPGVSWLTYQNVRLWAATVATVPITTGAGEAGVTIIVNGAHLVGNYVSGSFFVAD